MKLLIFITLAVIAVSQSKIESQVQVNDSDVLLYFYSQSNPSNGILTNISDPDDIAKTQFSIEKDTIFLIHGYLDTEESWSVQSIKSSYLEKHDVNIFIVNWDKIAGDWFYPVAQAKVEPVGKVLGKMIKKCVMTSSLNLEKTVIVGHSLGAHIAGVAGVVLDGQLEHIIGLDPAGPLFTTQNTENRLTTSSAQFVQAIHTCGGRLGYFKQIGHADYYVNGGQIQPMCPTTDVFGQCSHLKSIEYYSESILTGNFKSKRCDNYNDFKTGKCDDGEVSMMGEYNVDKTASGTYFLQTNNEPPYAKN